MLNKTTGVTKQFETNLDGTLTLKNIITYYECSVCKELYPVVDNKIMCSGKIIVDCPYCTI